MNKLFDEFKASSYDDWKQVADKSLKGKPFEDLIKEVEGVEVLPYYDSVNQSSQSVVKNSNDWLVFQQIQGDSPKEVNTQILKVLMNGINAIEIEEADNYDVVLKGVLLENISTYVLTNDEKSDLKSFVDYVTNQNYDKSKIEGGIVCRKDFNLDWQTTILERYNIVSQYLPRMKSIFVFNKEQSLVNQIAISLSKMNEYLYCFENKGSNLTEVAAAFQIHFEVGSNYFFEVAKFRAFRQLVAMLLNEYGVRNQQVFVSANTKLETSSVEKDYKNMLRSTTQAMSAVIGGCDSLSVSTFDGTKTDFSTRIARNVQMIIKQESYLDRVVDPSAGSYYIESITAELAKKSWEEFKRIEVAGGYVEAIVKKGVVNA